MKKNEKFKKGVRKGESGGLMVNAYWLSLWERTFSVALGLYVRTSSQIFEIPFRPSRSVKRYLLWSTQILWFLCFCRSDSGIKSKEVTPFLLKRVNELTQGQSLQASILFLTFSCYLPLICLNLSKRTYSSKFCLDHYHEERSRKFTVNFKEEFVRHCQLSSSKWRLYLYLLRHWAREMNSSWFII